MIDYPVPRTKAKLKTFLGLSSYFREFIPHYADVAFPLTELTSTGKPDKLTWRPEHQKSFDYLKNALVSRPVLRPPDMTKDFQLWVDASKVAISAILMQNENETKTKTFLFMAVT